jgi:hypothetical protein
MDYEKIYYELISYRRDNILTSGYKEVHHIIPRSLGGTNDKLNLVALTGREHYIAHLLLARFNRCSETVFALIAMQMKPSEDSKRPHIKNGRMYEWARKEFVRYMSNNAKITSKGERNSQYGTRWICHLELKENRKVNKDEPIPKGWILGRNKWVIYVKINRKKPRLESGKTAAQEQELIKRTQIYSIDNKIFIGLKSICECYNLTHPAVLSRIKSSKFPLWLKCPREPRG